MQLKTWTGALVAVTAMSIPGVLAQTPSPSASPPGASAATDAVRSEKIAVVGCLERGDQMASSSSSPSATGTTGTRGNESSSYILSAGTATPASGVTPGSSGSGANAASATGSAGTAAGSGATPGSGPMSNMASARTFMLEGRDQELSPHVNHQVEITGTIVSASASSPSASTGAASATGDGANAASPRAGSMASNVSAQRLRVDSVRMIASTCAAK